MNTQTSIDKSRAYVISQRQGHENLAAAHPQLLKPAITISHQTGAGASEIADQLAQVLQKTEYMGDHPWSVFDRQLVEKALEEQRWPKDLAKKITEEKRFFIDELMDGLFGFRPPSWVLVPQVVETTLRLSDNRSYDSGGTRCNGGHGEIIKCVSCAFDRFVAQAN